MDPQAHRSSYEDVRSASVAAHSPEDLDRLRELLFGDELRDIADLHRRLDELGITAENLAEKLPAAVALRSRRDKQLARALAPTIEDGLQEAVHRNPQKITDAIFPVLGPAIRKAIAETMASLVQTINRGIENSISPRGLRWRFEAWRTGVPYGEIVIKHALVYRVEQIFLIHSETGLLLSHVTADGVESPDADVVYSMLAAIKDFVHDSFKANVAHGMRRVSVADTVIFAQQGPHAVVGAVVRGEAPESLNERLMTILERVHLQYGEELEVFTGDAAPFADVKALLQDGLETELSTEQPGRSRVLSKVLWATTGLALLAAGAAYVLGVVRWNRQIRALQATPGVVVVEADRRFRGSHVSGLLDPDARLPVTILAANGFDTTRLSGVWEPYISADPTIIHARLSRLIGASPSVTWSIRGDTAEAHGTAPPAWLTRAASQPTVAGIAILDVSNVALQIPDTLANLQTALETRRVEFDVGTGAIPFRNLSQVDTVAVLMAAMMERADAHDLTVTFELIGRSDPAGTAETNRAISERRAESVRSALLQRGLASANLEVVGIGSSEPLTVSDGRVAEANRSVSFAARLVLSGVTTPSRR